MNFDYSTNGNLIISTLNHSTVGLRIPEGKESPFRNSQWGNVPSFCSLITQAAPGCVSEDIYDEIGQELLYLPNAATERACYQAGNYPFSLHPDKIYTYEHDFRSFVTLTNLYPDYPVRVDEEMYYYFLEVLPPLRMNVVLDFSSVSHKETLPVFPSSTRRYCLQVHYLMGEGVPLVAGFQTEFHYYCLGVSGGVKVFKPATPGRVITVEDLYYSH